MFRFGLFAVAAALVSPALGESPWQPDQVNTKMCQWQQLRAAVLRDTVYLDGGNLLWQPGFADGHLGRPDNDGNRLGLIYMLNFSTPFNTTQNISAILGTLATGGGGDNSRAPTYVDGALLGNDDEFFLYGGLPPYNNASTPPPGNEALVYYKYQRGSPEQVFTSGFVDQDLGPNVTRYIVYGGAASAPSENLAWYFSGLRSPSGGPIFSPDTLAPASTYPVNVSNTLITLDLAKQQKEIFDNGTLPSSVLGRANPELVWVPVGPRGILVALGGVVYPDYATPADEGVSANATASELLSPSFMSTIDIYDVATRKWHSQKTTGGPGQLTRGCAVVARAQDGSSFNIYYYGGYDGLDAVKHPFNDDVWVLSLPSFTWVKLATNPAGGRAGHKCVTPYPDQMLVIGGYPQLSISDSPSCLKEFIRVFNLSTGTWLERYDPAVYSNYSVPSAVHDKIGGSGTGGATATKPSPSGFDATELASIFATPYPVTKIATYYPYSSVGPTDNTNPNVPTSTPKDQGGGGGLPSYLPPVLGVVLGLVFLTMVAVLILLWRRRRLLRSGTISEVGTEYTTGNRAFIKSWLRGQPSEPKAPTVTTSDYTPMSSTEPESVALAPRPPLNEMEDTEVPVPPVELPADSLSPAVELHDNALASTATSPSLNPATLYAATHQVDHAAALTPSPPHTTPSPYPTPPPVPFDNESPVHYRPDSDALGRPLTLATTMTTSSPTGTSPTGVTPATARATKVLSGISNLSERDRSHLRQISDTTVSSVTSGGGNGGGRTSFGGGNGSGSGMASVVVGDRGMVESPAAVSPPTASAEGAPGGDYLSARPLAGQGQGPGPGSPLRRSVFSENIDGAEQGEGSGAGGSRRV